MWKEVAVAWFGYHSFISATEETKETGLWNEILTRDLPNATRQCYQLDRHSRSSNIYICGKKN
jgi:hypothetical protein